SDLRETGKKQLLGGTIEERIYEGRLGSCAVIRLYIRFCPHTPFIRFRYELEGKKGETARLTKDNGERLVYLRFPSVPGEISTEVRLSDYDSLLHEYCLDEIPAFEYEDDVMGPILACQRGNVCALAAYEHGSMYPDKFIAFSRDSGDIALRALRGNYYDGQDISSRPYQTVWLQIGAVPGTIDDLARAYRTFQLKYCTLNASSRKPYIFYNTWAFQERNKFYNRRNYLDSMNAERIAEEIEIAHRMGVDVFVLDTGWYQKTGDWEVDLKKFPAGLSEIREKLDGYGMKLGMWFGPTMAAATSGILERNRGCVAERRGFETKPYPIWETEESYPMCLVSEYWEDFADQLIRLAKTVGVTYFKWDSVDMYGCEREDHFHGTKGTSASESRDCHAFLVSQYMSKIVDKVCSAVPEAIVDMDVTEGGRCFGLGFMSSGKFFSINNGPYYHCYDIRIPDDQWSNIFVNPGPARTWICRQNLSYDRWIPSVLMMAHYIPDDPGSSQQLNIASLILGQNGIWGDLPAVSEDGVKLFGEILAMYKRVRDDITEAYPKVTGRPGEVFEAHEKISSGRGAIVLFANAPGHYEYRISAGTSGNVTVFGGASIAKRDSAKYIEADFSAPGAVICFFE
ncbi:MAG: alpha-galactosidase, partial [Clostridiales bacterium]|nr:alpha-galactosidase [Clostridiales bacterium]